MTFRRKFKSKIKEKQMKKILKFKCDYLTQDEYSRAMYFIKELSPNHFDKYDWGDRTEYYFMEEALK